MHKHSQGRKPASLLTILAASLVITACGDEQGGGKRESASSSGGLGGGLLCFAYLLTSGNDDCLSQVGTSSGSGNTSTSSGGSNTSSGGSSTPIAFKPVDEFEPNNTLPDANIVQFPKTYDRDGFIANGSVHDVNDRADVYTFARPFLRYHAFRLCSDGQMFCGDYGEIDTLTAYIDVLDSTGNVLASTQGGSSNYVRIQLAAGVPHFVRVVAGDTMATTVSYHLVVHEADY